MRKLAASFVLWYLRFFAKIQLFKVRPIIVGVGGASGKSSLVNFISVILSQKLSILETKGKNSETGIPLSILNLDVSSYTFFEWLRTIVLAPIKVVFDWGKYNVLVAEMGIDGPFEPKNMSYLLKIVSPKIGVLTNVSFEHSVYFEELVSSSEKILESTAQEEIKLLKALPKEGKAILNIDDPWIKRAKGIKAFCQTVSRKEASDYFIEKIDVSLRNFKVNFLFKGKRYKIKIPAPLPDHYAYSLVMALAVSADLGFGIEESIKFIESNFSTPPGRLSIFEGKKETTIIDSSYNNATLPPIMDILEFLKKISQNRRKVAILGDMRELGIVSGVLHQKLAKKILETTDLVILIGPQMKKFVAPILLKNKHKFYSFDTFSDSKIAIEKIVKKKDVILVKSSQNTLFLERVVEMLLKNPKDRVKLARRGKFWDKVRAKN